MGKQLDIGHLKTIPDFENLKPNLMVASSQFAKFYFVANKCTRKALSKYTPVEYC